MNSKKAKQMRRDAPKIIHQPKSQQAAGSLAILNVGKGDLKISFDPTNAKERDNSAKIVKDLLSQGYAIMVRMGGSDEEPIYQRVRAFDAKTSEYIVMGDPVTQPVHPTISDEPKGKRGRPRLSRVPSSRPSVAVARSAGGYDPVIPVRIVRGLPK